MAALTAGRTWKERVVLKGDFDVVPQVSVPSYTILDMSGAELTVGTPSAPPSLIVIGNSTPVAGNTQIEIVGGILDANGENQAIVLHNCTDSIVKDVTVIDPHNEGILLNDCERSSIDTCLAYNTEVGHPDADGFKLYGGCIDSRIHDCIARDMGFDEVVTTACGIEVQSCTSCSIKGNKIINSAAAQIQLEGISSDILIEGNILRDGNETGIAILGTGVRNSVLGNKILNCAGQGITLYRDVEGDGRHIVKGNSVFDSGSYGIWLRKNNWNIIEGNLFDDGDTHAMNIDISDYNIIKGNSVIREVGNDISLLGTSSYNLVTKNVATVLNVANTAVNNRIIDNQIPTVLPGTGANYWRDNPGYVTENYDAAVILNGNAAIVVAHGLAATPTSIRVTGTHTEDDLLYVDTVGAANFTIHAADGNVTVDRTVYWRAEV